MNKPAIEADLTMYKVFTSSIERTLNSLSAAEPGGEARCVGRIESNSLYILTHGDALSEAIIAIRCLIRV